uniref:Transposase n=1 Tax=Gongylonema pulchrum TaxID=637853 RepID=A0A183EVK3_9BILA
LCYFARLQKEEEEWTVEDFLMLLAQRRSSTLAKLALEILDGASVAIKDIKRRAEIASAKEAANKKQKRARKRK